MPANLTPDYFEAERAYRAATTLEDKIDGLERMLSVMPKHKGTDHLRAELTGKIAKLREQLERTPGAGRRRAGYHIKKEGAGQVALVGLTQSGKSHLVAVMSDVVTDIADHPFVTREPLPVMMKYENAPLQLVDMPALDYDEARPWLASVLRSADLLLVVIDVAAGALAQMERVLAGLTGLRLEATGSQPADGSPARASEVRRGGRQQDGFARGPTGNSRHSNRPAAVLFGLCRCPQSG